MKKTSKNIIGIFILLFVLIISANYFIKPIIDDYAITAINNIFLYVNIDIEQNITIKDQNDIGEILDNIIIKCNIINYISVYKFIPDKENYQLFKGQYNIATRSKNIINHFNVTALENDSYILQEIFMNKLYYDNINNIGIICHDIFNIDNFDCNNSEIISDKNYTLITVPIINNDRIVTGYILIFADNNISVKTMLSDLKTEITNISNILSK